MSGTLRGKAAVVGVTDAVSPTGELDVTGRELEARMVKEALDDAGLLLSDVDGVCHSGSSVLFAEFLGIDARFTDSTMTGGSVFEVDLEHAASAIAAGVAECVLVVFAQTPRASRHAAVFGTTPEQLATIAVETRRWACLNPRARHQEPIAVEDVLASEMIASPLHRLDCCLVTDGGGAFVVTSAERARDLRKPPVFVLGAATAHTHMSIGQMPDLTVTPGRISGPTAFETAGIGPSDVDVLMGYDSFTITQLLHFEDLGFCAKGEGGPFVESTGIGPGGTLPTNTNGGGAVSPRMEPPSTELTEPFWAASAERRYLVQWCDACTRPIFYPREACPSCLSPASLAWRESGGQGTVHAVSVQHRPAHPAMADRVPYAVALVDLDAGGDGRTVRVMTNVVGCDPGTVAVGQPVRLTWEALSGGRNLPQFEPAPPT